MKLLLRCNKCTGQYNGLIIVPLFTYQSKKCIGVYNPDFNINNFTLSIESYDESIYKPLKNIHI